MIVVDPGNRLARLLQNHRTGAGLSPLPFRDPDLPRHDWHRVRFRSNTYRALTSDPWILFSTDFNPAAVRFFAIQMSCSCDTSDPHAQISWCAENAESRSLRFPVIADGKNHLYVVDLHELGIPSRENIQQIRFAPLDAPGTFSISVAALAVQGYAPDRAVRTALGLPELRVELAKRYLEGSGIEIGALQKPVPVPSHVKIQYVDRLTLEEARVEYAELGDIPLVEPTIITDAGTLEAIPDECYDFCIASNVIEHMRDPIGALSHWLRVLKRGGILFLDCPDHMNFLDKLRPITPFDHLVADHAERGSREDLDRQHYFECVNSAHAHRPEPERTEIAERYFATNYAVHFHTFDAASFRTLLDYTQSLVGCVLEEYNVLRDSELLEFVAIIRKL